MIESPELSPLNETELRAPTARLVDEVRFKKAAIDNPTHKMAPQLPPHNLYKDEWPRPFPPIPVVDRSVFRHPTQIRAALGRLPRTAYPRPADQSQVSLGLTQGSDR